MPSEDIVESSLLTLDHHKNDKTTATTSATIAPNTKTSVAIEKGKLYYITNNGVTAVIVELDVFKTQNTPQRARKATK